MDKRSNIVERLRVVSHRLERSRADESGFMLIELIIVMQVIAILISVAVPSYLGFKVRAYKRTASSDVRSAIPTAELYYTDPTKGNLSYKNMTLAAIQAMAPGLKLDAVVVSTDFTTHCLHMSVGGRQSLVIRGERATSSGSVQEDVGASCPASAAL